MLTRRMMGARRGKAVNDTLSPYHLIVGEAGVVSVDDQGGLPYFSYAGQGESSYPHSSADEMSYEYRLGPFQCYVQGKPQDYDGTLPDPTYRGFSNYPTLLRTSMLSYLPSSTATEIGRIDWTGAALPTISTAAVGPITGYLRSSTGRFASLFKKADVTAGSSLLFEYVAQTSHYSNPMQKRIRSGTSLGTVTPTNPNIALFVSDAGDVTSWGYNDLAASIFAPVIPAGGDSLLIDGDRRRFVELARCQAQDAIYMLVQVQFEQQRTSGVFTKIAYPPYPGTTSNRYLYKTKACYAKRTTLAIVKLVDKTLSVARVLVSGQSEFPVGDYAYHKAGRENGVSVGSQIEWTRPVTSDSFRDANSQNNFGIQDEISPTEYLQNFDVIHAPGDPIKPWLVGEQVGPLTDNVPLLSPLLMPSSVTSSPPIESVRLAYDGTDFYVFLPYAVTVNGSSIQPMYRITSNGATLIRSAPLTANVNGSVIDVFEVFAKPKSIYAGNANTAYHFADDGSYQSFTSDDTTRYLAIDGFQLLRVF